MRRRVLILAMMTVHGLVPSAAPAEPLPMVVVLDREDRSSGTDNLFRAIQMQLSSLPVETLACSLDTMPPDLPGQVSAARSLLEEHDALAAVWCDEPLGSSARINILERGESPIRVRELTESGEAVRAEEAALIVRASITALLERGGSGAEPQVGPDLEADPVLPPPALTSDTRRVLALHVAFAMASFSVDHAVEPGAHIGLGLHLGRCVTLAISYTFLPPMETEGERASARVVRHPTQIDLHLSWSARKLKLGSAVAMEVDYLRAEAFGLQPGLSATGSVGDLVVSLCPMLSLAIPLSDRLTMFTHVLLGFPLNPHSYVLRTEVAGTEVLMAAWGIRPGIRVGVMADLF